MAVSAWAPSGAGTAVAGAACKPGGGASGMGAGSPLPNRDRSGGEAVRAGGEFVDVGAAGAAGGVAPEGNGGGGGGGTSGGGGGGAGAPRKVNDRAGPVVEGRSGGGGGGGTVGGGGGGGSVWGGRGGLLPGGQGRRAAEEEAGKGNEEGVRSGAPAEPAVVVAGTKSMCVRMASWAAALRWRCLRSSSCLTATEREKMTRREGIKKQWRWVKCRDEVVRRRQAREIEKIVQGWL